ncbi:prenyltransferase alpha subunit [Apiospora rasikravindrae]|uniref:Protein farnesyltransferase/geranylgeranyltransferase type-1 subunit alpha n=1 Tax=Apiospora rasikravindrae TaxID=990691 RepID=A0ABR1RR85_9PEZI
MPPKNNKGGAKAKDSSAKQENDVSKTQTVFERAQAAHDLTRPPYDKEREELGGLHALSTVEKTAYANWFCTAPDEYAFLSKKAQKELWKQVNETNRPLRRGQIDKPKPDQWGKDKLGRNIGDYTVQQYEQRIEKQAQLTCLKALGRSFASKRLYASKGLVDSSTGETYTLTEEDIKAEKQRRKEMAALTKDLYGEKKGPYSTDPEWDDVVPVPQMEPEGALAAIAYPEDYAESMSYLRAVMAANEYSPRCLKLTEHIISMNPAHYTVWLYRFANIQHLDIPLLDEIEWLNAVALDYLKNYQIWHHRQLLLEHYYPTISGSPDEVKRFARSERAFVMKMFAEDAKNYHVWSYRQHLTRKLGMWENEEHGELDSIEGMIDDDVRNNSAWSHRFFLVFSNPRYATPDSHATEPDPQVPADVVDREIKYAQAKIKLAPQNQSPWNYLRGVLVKGGRKLGSVQAFVEMYVQNLGNEETEQVHSSHALEHLADIYEEAGDREKADMCWKRLGRSGIVYVSGTGSGSGGL